MNLHLATVAQLIEWQAAIVDELARRAQPPAPPPPVAQPPWEMAAPLAPAMPVERMWHQPPPVAVPQHTPPQPPAMLAGQRGAMHATHKTDPALLARMQQVPLRAEGAPPVQGNGKGDGGQMTLEPKG